MNSNQQETSADLQETEFGGPTLSTQRRIIHFSSGETLEENSSEEEEEEEEEEEASSRRAPFSDAAQRTRLTFRNVVLLVGRISLLTCDLLGERLAGVLGLNAAKYQYAIDQHHRDQKKKSSKATTNLMEGQAETIHLSPGRDAGQYGATGDVRRPADSQGSCGDRHMDRGEGRQNRAYQADEDP